MAAVRIVHFTDPACPFAFSAEPVRQRLRWHYGEQLAWEHRMIVLSEDPDEPERLAEGAPGLQRRYGMPIDPSPYPGPVISEPACRRVVAARLNAPGAEERLLRELRVRGMAGGILADPALLDAAAEAAGLDPSLVASWAESEEVELALQEDIRLARSPSAVARALDHKLSGAPGARRYPAPSYELSHGDRALSIPGFNPIEVYEAAIANLAPELDRRPPPESVEELLAWAGEPLATAEITLVCQLDPAEARSALSRVARPISAGAEFYWVLAA